jgi:hypothetical protein
MEGEGRVMNKKTILFLILVLLCVVTIIVINIAMSRSDRESTDTTHQLNQKAVVSEGKNITEESSFSEDEQTPKPLYESTVSNGTILF